MTDRKKDNKDGGDPEENFHRAIGQSSADARVARENSGKFDGDEIRQRMVQFIKTHYAQTLGKDIELLDQPGGLEKLHKKYCL